jgi:hypothetical protein
MKVFPLEFSGNFKTRFETDLETHFKSEKVKLIIVCQEVESSVSSDLGCYYKDTRIENIRHELAHVEPYMFRERGPSSILFPPFLIQVSQYSDICRFNPLRSWVYQDAKLRDKNIPELTGSDLQKRAFTSFDCPYFSQSDYLKERNQTLRLHPRPGQPFHTFSHSFDVINNPFCLGKAVLKNLFSNVLDFQSTVPEPSIWSKTEDLLKSQLEILNPLKLQISFEDKFWMKDMGPITLLEAKKNWRRSYEMKLIDMLSSQRGQIARPTEQRIKQLLPKGTGVQVIYHFTTTWSNTISVSTKVLLFDWTDSLSVLNLKADLKGIISNGIREFLEQNLDSYISDLIGCFQPSRIRLNST